MSKTQQVNNWDDYRRSLLEDAVADTGLSKGEILSKRTELESDPLKWIRFFFEKYSRAEFSWFQRKAIKRLIDNPEWYEVLSWSRELSKTTTVMFVVLYLVLTGKKKNVILGSSSNENAVRLLEPYRANLDSNPRIRLYYGEQPALGHWEFGEFKIKNGASFRALGAGQNPRGSRNEEMRPDVVLVDDMDTDQDCRNPDIVTDHYNWFEDALYATRSISNPLLVIWCGNIIAKDCCITRAGAIANKLKEKNQGNWDVINIRDKNGKSVWPEKNTEEMIDIALSKITTRSAQQEYYNNPLAEGDVFKEIRWGSVPDLHKFKYLVSYGDPAPSNSKTKAGSYKSNFLVGQIEGTFYIIKGFLDHVTNAEYVDWYYAINEFVSGRTQVYYYNENNTLQDPFYQQVFIPLFAEAGKKKGYYLSIIPDDRKKPDKFSRIEGNLEPLNRQGRIVFNEAEKGNPHMMRLAEQFLLINPQLKAPADGPDCVEGAVFICNMKYSALSVNALQFGKARTNKKRI